MKTSFLSALILSLSLSVLGFGASGCGISVGVDASDSDSTDNVTTLSQQLISLTGITVQATYQEVITGTPTYGFPATSPMLSVHVEVSDAALRTAFPSFDGLERAFVMIPKLSSGRLVWEGVSLRYSGETRRGYYGDIKIDLHDSGSIWGVDLATLQANGVAVGLETNVGVVWAQPEGKNHPVTRK